MYFRLALDYWEESTALEGAASGICPELSLPLHLGQAHIGAKGTGHKISSGVGTSIIAVRNWREISRSTQTSPREQSAPLQGEEDAHSRLSLQQ